VAFPVINITHLQVYSCSASIAVPFLFENMSPLAISFGTPHETKGEVRAFAFVYSGNFLVEAELGEMGRLRYTMGIHPMGMQWHLNAGEFFATPEVVMVRSSDGIGGMSRTFHRLFLERLLPKNWSDKNPPILLNTWEAKYFHVTHDNVIEMARQVR
jgi:alpha-galactosidase